MVEAFIGHSPRSPHGASCKMGPLLGMRLTGMRFPPWIWTGSLSNLEPRRVPHKEC